MSKEEATKFFSDFFFGEHHIPGEIKKNGHGWEIVTGDSLCSYDYSNMTRLVIMAHDRAIRVAVVPHTFKLLRIIIHQREREGGELTKHPDLESNVARLREIIEKQSTSDRWN